MKYYTFVDYATQVYSAMVAVLILIFHGPAVPHWQLLIGLHMIGIALVHAIVVFGSRGGERLSPRPLTTALSPTVGTTCARPCLILDLLRHFYPVLLYTFFFCETGWLDRMIFSDILDPAVIRWEQAIFHSQPGVTLMERVPYLWASEILYGSYFSYYLMISGVALALFRRNRQQFFHYISVVSFLFYICYTIYILLPVIGPRVFFGEIAGYRLPENLQQLAPVAFTPEAVKAGPFYRLVAWIYATFESPGAALPSSHVAVALCTLYFAFRYRLKVRYIHFVLVVLLCISTVYCRYHYGVDVIAGIATTALILPVGNWLYFRLRKKAAEGAQTPPASPDRPYEKLNRNEIVL